MLIGIVGLAGSGKDTIGQFLIDQHSFQKDSFAAPLKNSCCEIFGWSQDMVEGSTSKSRAWREEPDPFWSKVFGQPTSPRMILQNVGTNIFRNNLHHDIWILSLKRRLLSKLDNTNIVITDCRFPNEIHTLKELGGIIINVRRGKTPEWVDDAYKANAGDPNAKDRMKHKWKIHESEWAFMGHPVDHIIHNDGDFDTLKMKINALLFEGPGI